ncbi:MAG TPA: YbfB/YjiJ family MFS transporter [Caldimonas sp.]|nr:YbfB/YjiJ family MFS transporter [Caldimonas sp.]
MSESKPRPSATAIAIAGLIALAVAMGIGRFAFTPILPMMLHDGVVDLHAASWLASANYLGYLAGALLCTFVPLLWPRLPRLPPIDGPTLVRTGLAATAVLTLAMALPAPALWPVLRFLAGVASAMVFVFSSAWCLAQLAARGQASLGGAMFAGPGAGIVASGLLASAMVAWHWHAADAWLVFGVLACLLSAPVWRVFKTAAAEGPAGVAAATAASAAAAAAASTRASTPASASVATPTPTLTPAGAATAPVAPEHPHAEVAALAVAYGISGFGYIVTATFLPVIARAALPADSPWFDLFWPIFGAGVILGALLATRARVSGDLRLLLGAAYLVQAVGIAIGLAAPTAAGFALGSFLLGLPFTALTYFALQEVRRLRPRHVASTTGLVTAIWSLGQTAGPAMVAVLLRRTTDVGAAFTLSLVIAAGALVVGGLVFFASSRLWPRHASR